MSHRAKQAEQFSAPTSGVGRLAQSVTRLLGAAAMLGGVVVLAVLGALDHALQFLRNDAPTTDTSPSADEETQRLADLSRP
jgi:hypothetical protein